MTVICDDPVSDDDLLDYWIGAIPEADAERIEEHLFSCGACAAQLEAMVTLGAGLADLVRRGHVSGIVSHALLNRVQRDGVHVRTFTLSPGDRVPCAAFPGDDLLVVSLRANVAGADMVTLSVTGPGNTVIGHMTDVPVTGSQAEILWATPGDTVRQIPSSRVRLTLTSQAAGSPILAEYELEHTELPPG